MGPGSLGQLEIRLGIKLGRRKLEWKIIIPLKIVLHGYIAMTSMTLNRVISCDLQRGTQPEVEVDGPWECELLFVQFTCK